VGESPLLTISETARFLRTTPQTVRRWAREGQLPAVRVGGQWRIDSSGELADISTSARGRGEFSHPTTGRIR
jgi:PTS system nitrogen regulatory IIA component